jgi:hypothetical protein
VFIAAGTLACAVIIVVITVRHGVLVPSVMHSDIVISRFSILLLSFRTTHTMKAPHLISCTRISVRMNSHYRHYSDTRFANFRTSVALTFNYFTQLLHLYKLVTLQNSFPCSNICPTRCNVTQFILSGNCSTCFG